MFVTHRSPSKSSVVTPTKPQVKVLNEDSSQSTSAGFSQFAPTAGITDDNDENFAPVPQVKVGPDGKIILNVDR